jgi:large subunit ribosomal protein L14
MKGLKTRVTHGIQKESLIPTCDNSGAKYLRVISFRGYKGRSGRHPTGGVSGFITASVVKGNLEMRKKVVNAVIVRQTKEYRRPDGMRIKFEDNAAVVLKDDKGNPKGTLIKGPIAKEVVERWPAIGKLAKMVM